MGHAPKAPPPPQPSAAETALMEKQGLALDSYLKSLEEQKIQDKQVGLLTQVSSGLYDPVYKDGKLIDATLNQDKVSALQSSFQTNQDIQNLQAERLQKALKGELPVSQGLMQQKNQDFQLLKENAARKGIMIEGDTPETALSKSTSGNELLGQFNRTYGLLTDAERRGEIANVSGVSLGTQPLSILQNSSNYGPGASLSGYSQGVGLLGAAQQPYQYNRNLQFQTSNQNAINRAGQRAGYAGLLGQGLGTGTALAALTL